MYVIDYDSPPSQLVFSVKKPPENGFLRKKEFRMDKLEDSVVFQKNSSFTYKVSKDLLIDR